jgi:glycosyltransferase involved in cell wall biosynthesis
MSKSISIVIPSFNEAENIEELYSRIVATLKKINISDYEIIYIENGSTDKSLEILKNLNNKDKSVKIISFSRNFGLQSAIYAGLTEAEKNYVCVLDGDLQDPPELIEDFFNKIDKGFDIVYGIRKKRITNFFKNYCYKLFYFFLVILVKFICPHKLESFV